jgi:hypothetical protein
VWGVETTLVTSKALFEVASEPTLTSARLFTVRARYRQVALLLMLIKLRLTRIYEFAAVAPKVVALMVCFQRPQISRIKVAAYL